VAATYDGTILRLYINGVQVSTRAFTASLAITTQPLHIGGNAIWNEWYAGLIDEVRVYNRALSVAEIQTDMTRAVVS
jgi:hypothetical protein